VFRRPFLFAAMLAAGGLMPALAQTSAPAAERTDIAARFAEHYLWAWSSANPIAIPSMEAFYAQTVTFHGRDVSYNAVVEEKRRFVRRWPIRDYRHRPGSMNVQCDAEAEICVVQSVIDYTARDHRGRRARGSAEFELGLSFASGRPVIVYENSRPAAGRTAAAD